MKIGLHAFYFYNFAAMNAYYNDFSSWIREQFPYRVQKISVDAGFTCPNRDGRIGRHGCTYCNNQTFTPSYCDPRTSVAEQLEKGKQFFARKYPEMKYLAYFQSYTNTYDADENLFAVYEAALQVKDVVGIVVGTRPDCMTPALLDYFAALRKRYFVLIEYGIESTNDATLKRINRGHDFACCREVIAQTHARGLLCGGHVILGLPGEDAAESVRQASVISELPIDILKLHQMQVIRGTALARQFAEAPFPVYSVDDYIALVARYIAHLRPSIVLERFVSQSPAQLLIAPQWGLKNYEFTNRLHNYLKGHSIRQGMLWKPLAE